MPFNLEMIIQCDICGAILGGGETGAIEASPENAYDIFSKTIKEHGWVEQGCKNICDNCQKSK